MREILLAILILGGLIWAEDFESFKNRELQGYSQEQKDFERYKKEVELEFQEYKRIAQEEFRKFKKEVLKVWSKYEESDRKKLVQYSEDLKVKRVFDFEKGELRIEAVGNPKNFKGLVKRELRNFLTQDKREAFKKDRVLSNIERRVRSKLKHVETARVDREPILTPIMFGKSTVSGNELSRGIDRLLTRGRFYKTRNSRTVNVFKVKLPPKRILIKAKKYKPIVVSESKKRKLSHPLIFAIIHTESSFNPLARSHVPAYGLMQIVPHTAGRDVTKFLYGRPKLLSPSYLYNAKNNIKIGTTYVYMLYYKYFKDVRDPESRLYCTIAAYNTGAGNVARAFVGSTNLSKAIRVINRMSPEDVYRTLLRNLPYDETRQYLKKVSARIAVYKNL